MSKVGCVIKGIKVDGGGYTSVANSLDFLFFYLFMIHKKFIIPLE